MKTIICVTDKRHSEYAASVCQLMEEAAKVRGTGIAKRNPDYITSKIESGNAIIAINNEKVVGFSYIESWENQKFVANSGLIVHPDFRGTGLAKQIKSAIFELSKRKYPYSKIFGITTSMAVMKINSDLGYKPASFSEITKDKIFWDGCKSCVNYDILVRTQKQYCLCTGMIYIPDCLQIGPRNSKLIRWEKFKRFITRNNFKSISKRKLLKDE